MRCFMTAIVLLCSISRPPLAAEAKPPAKDQPEYFKVEIRGPVKFVAGGAEMAEPHAAGDFTATILGTALHFGDNKEAAARAKSLDGQTVLVTGYLGPCSPMTAGRPIEVTTYVQVTTLRKADDADAPDREADAHPDWLSGPEAAALLKGIVVTGTMKQVIGGFNSFGTPAAGDTFELDLDNLPHEKIDMKVADPDHGPHYVPFSAPLRVERVKQVETMAPPRRTVILLSAADASGKILIAVTCAGLEKGSAVTIRMYASGGFLGSMAEAQGVVKRRPSRGPATAGPPSVPQHEKRRRCRPHSLTVAARTMPLHQTENR